MALPVLVSVMGLLTVVGVYFWCVRKPEEPSGKETVTVFGKPEQK